MKKINIALLAGGGSSEREVSLGSADQINKALDRAKYNVYLIDVQGDNWHYADSNGKKWQIDKNDFSLTVNGEKILLDYALMMIHGTPCEDGKFQGYLDMMGVSYSACGVESSVITFDKITCKRTVKEIGIPLAKEVVMNDGDVVNISAMVKELGLPMFIKPNASGSSCGVTRVNKIEQIPAAINAALEESSVVLAEEFVAGREVSCGVLITSDREYLFPITEIISKKEFFDYEAKYTPGCADEITPADLDDSTVRKLNEMTVKAYKACNCKGVARVDFIVKPDGTPIMIEINTIPGMSSGSIVPQQVAAAGMTLSELCDVIIKDTYKERI